MNTRKSFLYLFTSKVVLFKFFKIKLSNFENQVAYESIVKKYIPALRSGIISALLIVPTVLFLDTSIIIQVLIPVTMVAGTAWFAVSLASMKKKFESFGLELTKNLFSGFVISLFMLFVVAAFSLTHKFWHEEINQIRSQSIIFEVIASLCGIYVVGNLLFQIFLGSLKYDMNDAMLTGQNEAAERFFKKALSVLYSTASTLKDTKSLQVANYLIGVSFFEIYQHINKIIPSQEVLDLIKDSNKLIFNPSMKKSDADELAIKLLSSFINFVGIDKAEKEGNKNFTALEDEFTCLSTNTGEDQEMIDIRLSVVFEEIATLMEDYGESLFRKNKS